MKTGLVLLATALLAVVVTGPAFAQSRTRTSDSVSRERRDANPTTIADRQAFVSSSRTQTSDSVFRHRNYRYRGYDYSYGNRYGDDGYYNGYYDGYSAPLAMIGGAAAVALGGGTPHIVGAAALGWLLGQHLDASASQQPVELVEWSEDSNGNRYWQKSGSQTKMGDRPDWVGRAKSATPSPPDSVRSTTPSPSELKGLKSDQLKKLEGQLEELRIQIQNEEKARELKKQIYQAKKS